MGVLIVSALAVMAGVVRYLEGENLGFGVMLTIGVASYYLLISLGALLYFGKDPVSYESNSFFDYRPLKITSIAGNPHVDEAMGISFMISETAIQFIHKGPIEVGMDLTLDLELPALPLHLSGSVRECRSWSDSEMDPLYIIEVGLSSLTAEAKQHLSMYFFEHATPKAMNTTANLVKESIERFAEATQRRQLVRQPTLAPVVIETAKKHGSLNGLLLDVTADGGLLSLHVRIDPGTQLRIRLPWTGSSVFAEVARCEEGPEQINPVFRVGVKFTTQAEMESKYLAKFYQVMESGVVKIRTG